MNANHRNARQGKALAVVAVALLVLVVVVAAWRWGRAPDTPDLDQGRATADLFLEQIRAGNPREAWESTSAEFKSAEGAEVFLRSVKRRPWLAKPLEFVTVETIEMNRTPRAEYHYRTPDGRSSARVLIATDRGVPRVDRLAMD